ncbi:hypothetical protein SB659_18275 [Arthrobacter sp. SIMBA_036]|uniref:hypothetical protein n=1 Tax=Arthrobacter sp. SIMBA_036 TaxID=3085778 RepID=UPI00397BD3E2
MTALKYVDRNKEAAEIVVMLLATEASATTIRKRLAIGASSAMQITDEALIGADLGVTAEVRAVAFKRMGFIWSSPPIYRPACTAGVLQSMIAKFPRMPQLSLLWSIEITDSAGSRAPACASHRDSSGRCAG